MTVGWIPMIMYQVFHVQNSYIHKLHYITTTLPYTTSHSVTTRSQCNHRLKIWENDEIFGSHITVIEDFIRAKAGAGPTKLIFQVLVVSRINHSAMFWSSESPFQPISPTPSTKFKETNMTWTKILSLCWNPRFSKYLSLIRSWSQALFFHVTCLLRLPFSPFPPGPQVSHLVQQWWNTPCHSCSKRNYI